ncbi:amidase [Streptomyces sp. H10-C2]|uniref:amidase n=1 Tax=unclassified Streptomyces TaxID=2593676 RepID=UPI0024B99620|nr:MULTISPECIES: amidase [unclassified Streptomyces]MDJ0340093.1 amidase [Streptomyces sp. PH10-H1]MDJ0369270.1 amidase [Streptomyces sp. H10-C2]
MGEPHELTMLEQAAAIRGGELSPVELARHYLERIARLNDTVGAYVTVTPERALDDARRAERRLAAGGVLPPLLGVPVPVKDLTPVAGVRFTSGSAVFAERVAESGTHVVELLQAAGTVLLGKTNTPEFGLPAYTEGRVAPPARSPYDTGRIAGGSSGGSAAAVAAGLAPAAHGSDGGGSIRIPASCCGVVGLKPSRGRVSPAPNGDVTGLAVHGPIARNVRDVAALLDVMAGPVPGDPVPLAASGTPFLEWCDREPRRLRIGRWARPDVAGVGVDPVVLAAYERTSALLAGLGHEVVEVEQPLGPGDHGAFDPVWEVMALMAPVPERREGELMPLTRWLRERGRAASGERFALALAAMQGVGRKFAAAVASFDAVLTPTLAQLPPAVGALRDDADPEADFAAQYAFTPFTGAWNIAGLPSVSLPVEWTDDGLPVGMMLGAAHGAEGPLLALAAQVEAAAPWRDRRPPVW